MYIFSLFLATILLGTKVFAAQLPDPGTLPGSFWYPFKIWIEEVGDWFTFGEVRTMDRLLDRSSLRLAEVQALAGGDDTDSSVSAEQAYQDTWQEFWSSLEQMEEPLAFTEKSIRLLMDHRQSIGSMRINLNKTWTSILNGEVRGVKILLDEDFAEGEKFLTDVLVDRVRMIPQTGFNDILALDPLVGVLRTTGEKKVIAMMIDMVPVLDDAPASEDHDRVEQHVFQIIRGDLVRYVPVNPDDAVVMLRDLLEGALHRVEVSMQEANDARILKNLGRLSVALGIVEEISRDLLLPSRAPAAQSLKNILSTVSARLDGLTRTGHEAMANDQRMRMEGIVRILEGSQVREDLARTIPPELLKMFPDLPWKIPASIPGAALAPDRTDLEIELPARENLLIQKKDLRAAEEKIKSRLAPMLPVQERPVIKIGEDPSVRLREMLKEKSGTLSPIPVDLKVQAIPKVR